jgi:sialidase-1
VCSAVLLPAQTPEITIFQPGMEGYKCFRIPAVVCTTSTVLAFAEGRRYSQSDTGNIDLVLRRSLDGGRTWAPLQVVWSDADNTCGNPAPVIDRDTGAIWLLMTHNLGTDGEKAIHDGVSSDTRRVFITHSTDEGATWPPPDEITSQVKSADWRWYATGPCHGIQLRDGRLVVSANHSAYVDGRDSGSSHIIASDDHGRTWHAGRPMGERTNESTVAELPDGRLYLNARSYRGSMRRAFAFSTDRGESWSGVANDPVLIEPVCQGSVLRHIGPDRKSWYLFSNPAATTRSQMTIRCSETCDKWSSGTLIYAGPSMYSDMCSLAEDEIGLIYEKDFTKPQPGLIVFRREKLGALVRDCTPAN